MKLIADVEPTDRARAARLTLAWLRGDKAAMEFVLDEANAEPAGLASLIFALTDYSTNLTEVLAPNDAEEQLERSILRQLNAATSTSSDHDASDDDDDRDP